MRTYHQRLSRLTKPGYVSRHTMLTGSAVLGLILLIDLLTIRYFPQVQSALTLPAQTRNVSNTSAIQVPVMTNGATATTSHSTTTTTTGTSTPAAKPTATATAIATGKALAQDTFARPDQSLWGAASDGQPWTADAMKSPVFSIVNHSGLISNGSGIYDAILGPRAADSEVLFTGSVSNLTASNMGALLRWTDTNNMYKVFIDGSSLIALKKVKGVVTILQSVPFLAQNGRAYSIRARVAGQSIMARAWPAGQVEPPTWMLTASDGDLASGFDGLRLIVQSGVTITVTSFLESQA